MYEFRPAITPSVMLIATMAIIRQTVMPPRMAGWQVISTADPATIAPGNSPAATQWVGELVSILTDLTGFSLALSHSPELFLAKGYFITISLTCQ